jgi:TRAP-type C4-dicarboxylate transport system permease small subunit
MGMTKIIAIVLIVAGTLGLIYGGFSYTKEKHDLKIGTLQFSLAEKETVNVPVWAGAGAIAVGVILLLFGRKP